MTPEQVKKFLENEAKRGMRPPEPIYVSPQEAAELEKLVSEENKTAEIVDLAEARADKAELEAQQGAGFWHVPNAYAKKIRKLTMNEVRAECMRLAGALMDQRNANYILLEELKNIKKVMDGQKEVKND